MRFAEALRCEKYQEIQYDNVNIPLTCPRKNEIVYTESNRQFKGGGDSIGDNACTDVVLLSETGGSHGSLIPYTDQ
jgi:hypothetical protein